MAKRIIKQSNEPDYMYLGEAFEDFMNEKEANGLANASLISYETTFKAFCKFFDFTTDTTTEDIEQQLIFKWIGSMRLDGLKPASINHYLRDIRAFLYWCMDETRGYMQPFKIQTVKAQEEQLKLYTDEELELLLQKPRRTDSFTTWRTWTIVNWVLATGNRASTICDVKLTDINFSRKEIVLGHTKNKKAQIIPLSSSLETVLKEYIRRWRSEAPKDGWLFPNVGEEKLTTNALRLSYGRYTEACGVEKSNIHGLRHNFAKGWIRNNGNQFTLQNIMGHSTLDMTKKYVRLFAEDIKNDYDAFSPLDTIKKNAKRKQAVKRNDD